MFSPPRCPDASCAAHSIERRERHEVLHPQRLVPPQVSIPPRPQVQVPGLWARGFSRQTFRQDYRDHKPHLNARLLELLAHGLGLRQSATILKLSRRCTEMKARKLSRHLEYVNRNLLDQFPEGCSFQMDEMETFETEPPGMLTGAILPRSGWWPGAAGRCIRGPALTRTSTTT